MKVSTRILVLHAARLYVQAEYAPNPQVADELRRSAGKVQIRIIELLGENPAIPAGELIDRAIVELKKKKRTCKP